MRRKLNRQYLHPRQRANLRFFEIVGLGSLWILISLAVIGRHSGEILRHIYYICQSSWENLSQHLPPGIQLIIPFLMIVILGRGVFLFVTRLWATRKFSRALLLFQAPLPSRLMTLARRAGLQEGDLVCFETAVVRAFSLGIWRPRIWLSTGLLALLTEDELMAVLQHEAYHCQQRDPLRLLVSRLISDIFFFVPILRHLVEHNHLAQEMAADARAINIMRDALPLASALHKLLTSPHTPLPATGLAVSQLNITERRILALVSPGQHQRWQPSLVRWAASLALTILILGSFTLTSPGLHQTSFTCNTDQVSTFQLNLPDRPDIVLR